MQVQTPFLARLDLAPDADERAVRRAYARELKLVDQERDLEDFQYLRACYEAALEWVARRDGSGTQGGDAHPQQALPEATPSAAAASPEQLAAAVFEDFGARLAQLVDRADLKPSDDAARIAPWMSALHEALGDPRLLNLDARLIFEHAVASLLADGWQPAHHVLLVAAATTFGWSEDRQALRRLGYPGALLDEALEQRAMFDAQTAQMRAQQRDVLSLLRGPDVPGVHAVRQRMRALHVLEQRFPALLHVVAPRSAVEAWRRIGKVETAPLGQAGAGAPSAQDAKRHAPKPFGLGALAMVLIAAVSHLMNEDTSQSSHYRPPPALPAPAQREPVLTNAHLARIERLIAYSPDKTTPAGEQRARLQVWLDWGGMVTNVALIESEGDLAFTAAVERAVRASSPFPDDAPRSFEVTYRVTVPAASKGT